MRKSGMLLGLVLLAGCSADPEPNAFSGPVPAQAMSCVPTRLENVGYRQVSGGPDSGVARFERLEDEPWYLEVLGMRDWADIVDVAATPGQMQLVVTGQVVKGRERFSAAPDPDARRQAREIFTSCI